MATGDTPEVTMVAVTQHVVNVSLTDILTPLTQTAANLAQSGHPAVQDPEIAQHLQNFADLVSQLQDVVTRINQLDATVLASRPGPPPSA
jgi:hypothetical protein